MTDAEGLPGSDAFTVWADTTLKAVSSPRRSLSIRIVDENGMRRLGRDFTGKERATNVLSFPFDPVPGVEMDWLGDIVICAPVVADEAGEQGKPICAHWAHMVIHGILHLCGFDHINEAEALEMETLETRLLDTLGYPDPYRVSDQAGCPQGGK